MTHTPEKNGENTFCDVDGSMNGIVGFLYNWWSCIHNGINESTAREFIWTNCEFDMSGIPEQYVPYSTTRKSIQEWVSPSTPYK